MVTFNFTHRLLAGTHTGNHPAGKIFKFWLGHFSDNTREKSASQQLTRFKLTIFSPTENVV
jgi:hypothetical protein